MKAKKRKVSPTVKKLEDRIAPATLLSPIGGGLVDSGLTDQSSSSTPSADENTNINNRQFITNNPIDANVGFQAFNDDPASAARHMDNSLTESNPATGAVRDIGQGQIMTEGDGDKGSGGDDKGKGDTGGGGGGGGGDQHVAHEVAHTVQQGGGGSVRLENPMGDDSGDGEAPVLPHIGGQDPNGLINPMDDEGDGKTPSLPDKDGDDGDNEPSGKVELGIPRSPVNGPDDDPIKIRLPDEPNGGGGDDDGGLPPLAPFSMDSLDNNHTRLPDEHTGGRDDDGEGTTPAPVDPPFRTG